MKVIIFFLKKLGFITGIKCEGAMGRPCPSYNAEKYRQNTQYYNDADNFVTLCPN